MSKYEGKGPNINGTSVFDFGIKAFNRGDDQKAFDRFNFEITQFSADVALRINTKGLDTSGWAQESMRDEAVDNKAVLDAIAAANAEQLAEMKKLQFQNLSRLQDVYDFEPKALLA